MLQKFSDRYEICFSDTGIEYAGSLDDTGVITMVYDDFTDEIFNKLSTRGCCIMGPQIIITSAAQDPVSSCCVIQMSGAVPINGT